MNGDLEVALEAARKGVEVIRSFQDEEVNIRYKGRNDLVTDADVATQEAVISVLKSRLPDDQILAEESGLGEGEIRQGRVWIIDPIDGTTNFAYNFPLFCVSVGLCEDGQPIVGVVIEVNLGEEFTAVKGEGAWLNGKRIRVSGIKESSKALIGTGFPYNDRTLVDEYMNFFRSLMDEVQGIRRPGAATYDLCCVAAGRFQGFYEYALQAWDVAAAALIIQEAGGLVTDWNGGDNWLFGERIVAGNPAIHTFLLDKIREMIPEEHLA